MPEIVSCDCIPGLPLNDKLDQIFCVLSTLASGEAGDATAANQLLEIAQLTAINGNTDALPTALGQALMAASLPVVIASNQTSFPVTIAAGSAVIGHVIVDSGTITTVSTVTAVTAITNALPTGTNSIGGTKDNGPQWTPTRTYTAITTATTTDITVAPTGGQKIYADDILISSDTAMGISIIEETSGTVFSKVYVPANGTVQITLRDGIKAAVADKKLRAITSAAGNVSITCCYHSET